MANSQGKTIDTNALTVGLATIKMGGTEIGSVTDGTLEVTLETLEHKTGLPLTIDKKVVIEKGARFTATWEEVKAENLRLAIGVPTSELTSISGTANVATVVTQQLDVTNETWAGMNHNSITTLAYAHAAALTAGGSTTTAIKISGTHHIRTLDTITIPGYGAKAISATDKGTTGADPISGVATLTSAAFATAPTAGLEVYVSTLGATGSTFTEYTDFVIDRGVGRVRGIPGGTIRRYARIYMRYSYSAGERKRIPLGTSTSPIEVPVEIIHTRPDSTDVNIYFWKASPGGTFSLPFSPNDWVGYPVEITSLYDNNHTDSPLGYIELSV